MLIVTLVAVLPVAGCVPRCQGQGVPTTKLGAEEWAAKIHAGWVGKVSAGSGALPTERWTKEQIRAQYGELSTPPQTPTARGPLDDTTLAFLGWCAVREHGANVSSADIAKQWADHLAEADLKGGGYGQEFLEVLSRLRKGERPPIHTGSSRDEWIAAQMRAEIWGMLAPGEPELAAELARRDAVIFNVGNGVYAAQFVAVLAGQLMVDPHLPRAVDTALGLIPADSVLARVVGDTLRWHAGYPKDWEATWQSFVEKYRDRSLEKAFAAWSPGWLVETSGWPEAEVLSVYRGRKSVLRTHPFGATEPATLTTEVNVPPSGGTLKVSVNCNELPANVDWLLRVRLAETVIEEPIHWVDGQPRWQEFSFDLKPWAGKRLTISLENDVLGKFAWEAGFWTKPELVDGDGKPLLGKPPAGRACRYPVDFAPRIVRETFSVLVGLLYGEGDFRRSVSLTTMCGFDTDCNAGTVGCLLGLRNGLDAIPGDWKAPLADTYELQVSGYPRTRKIADLARRMAETGAGLARGHARPTGQTSQPRQTAARASVTTAPVVDPPEGFGASAKGGEGGRTIVVTTLADSGPGSLRDALGAQGPRVVVFAVEGTIALQSRLRCTNGNITIDGATAPGKGITLLNHGIQFRGDCDDIIVRNLRIRVTTGGDQGDCLLFWGTQGGTVERVLVDHCSLMWATDEVVNTWGQARDITVQWTLIAEAQLPHTKGWLSGVGSDRVTIHHCLFAQNGDRNPKLEGGVYDVVNNVFYNWQVNNAAKLESGAQVNLVNNWFLPGPDSAPAAGCVFPQDPEKGTKVYLSGNLGPYSPTGAEDQWPNVTWYEQQGGKWVQRRPAPVAFRADKPFAAATVTTQPAKEAYEAVLAQAGAKVRDDDDLRVLQSVRGRTGHAGRQK